MSNYPKPCITADVIVSKMPEPFSPLKEFPTTEILLIQRGKDPFKGCWALPGGHFDVETDESILHCAIREIKEETNLDVESDDLKFVGYFDAKDRDPRGRYVGFVWAYECPIDFNQELKAGDDAANAKWFRIDELPELSFDHKNIIQTWIEQLIDQSLEQLQTGYSTIRSMAQFDEQLVANPTIREVEDLPE